MLRWAIILNRQMLFCTGDREITKRFLAMGFQIFDHEYGCYTHIDHRDVDARDLLTETDYLGYGGSDTGR